MGANRIATVGRKKKVNPFNARLDLRSEPEWMERVEEAARRRGQTVSAYIRFVMSEHMDKEGIPRTPPTPKKKPKPD